MSNGDPSRHDYEILTGKLEGLQEELGHVAGTAASDARVGELEYRLELALARIKLLEDRNDHPAAQRPKARK